VRAEWRWARGGRARLHRELRQRSVRSRQAVGGDPERALSRPVIVVDTGPLVAIGDRSAREHQACRDALRAATPPRLVPGPVIAEVCYLLAREVGIPAEASFLRSFSGGFFTPLDTESADLERAAELVETYADLPLGGTDACVVALAERLGVGEIATIDRRHFSIVRPLHVEAFTLSLAAGSSDHFPHTGRSAPCPTTSSIRRPWHNRRVHQPSVR
jgi:predicted nucleic acid-binding protein